jgi:hypothetical protein
MKGYKETAFPEKFKRDTHAGLGKGEGGVGGSHLPVIMD